LITDALKLLLPGLS